VGELNIDLYQDELEGKIDGILEKSTSYLTKEDVKHEIRSNHYMTNKVIEKLVEDGFIQITKEGKVYKIRITKKGVLHIRMYNRFYKQIYNEQIKEHYKYRGLPHWFIRG
jgi:predicted transcriptional regulator